MPDKNTPVAIMAAEAAPRTKPSNYPEPFAARMAGREKRPLGDVFGLSNFGVNLTRLAPGASSALRHAHSKQDEFIYVLHGRPVLRTDAGETQLSPGMCAGFKAGTGNGLSCLTAQARMSSTLRSVTAVRATPLRTLMMTYRRFWSRANGNSRTRMAGHTEIR